MNNINRLETKILLRYATYSQWLNSDVILQPGEAAIAAFPNQNVSDPPRAVGIKIGDGRHYFDELPWIQAISADVYSWAKELNKPIYTADEIDGLAAYIASHTEPGSGGSSGSSSSSAYRLVYNANTKQYVLQQYDETTEDWVNTSSVIDLSTINARIQFLENWANGEFNNIGENLDSPLILSIRDELLTQLNRLDVDDYPVSQQFVTAVSETDGKISVSRKLLSATDIGQGILSVSHGGLGGNEFEAGSVLIGNDTGPIQTKLIVNTIDEANRDNIPSTSALITYVNNKTAGLTGAMHFIGEATVAFTGNHITIDPRIPNYDFRNVQLGDVVLVNNTQEYVWTGTNWRLLGDEGSYAIKGSIVDADISNEAAIQQSKIYNLEQTFFTKVDKVEGKQLSSNDYTSEEKDKLDGIQAGAQVNTIEHILLNNNEILPKNKAINLEIPILTQEQLTNLNNAQANVIENIFVNNVRLIPSTIENLPKSVAINFIPYTQAEKDKLADIEAGAQVNAIETISINGRSYTPNNNKDISITIDQAALNLNVLAGARVLKDSGNGYDEIDITTVDGVKILELARIAKTGNIKDIIQSNDEYAILYCGNSTEVI